MNTFFIRKKYTLNGKKLDRYQIKAVMCNAKSYLVVAGAGSGKTFTINAKIKYLLEHNVKESEILCISFTNETVNSLKESLIKNNINVNVLTFHRLSLSLIKNENFIINDNLLEYITDEYFYSYIYFDNTYKLLSFIENIEYTKKVIIVFIKQLKAMNFNELFILNLLKNKLISSDNKIILILILKVYLLYSEELKSTNRIDFDDIINISINKVDSLKNFKYKYLIIDEYQDTSISKYLLIKKLIDKFNIKLMAVGDDYQSIYSFTGCNLSLFTKFKKYFPKSKIIKLKYTYRNPSDISEISRRLIMKNKTQINKKIKALKYIKDSINIVYYDNEENVIVELLKEIDNVLILGRNNKDLDNLLNKEIIVKKDNKYIYNIDKEKIINFLTIHKSKGLEEDNIIVLNMIDDTLGFPNKIKENEILSYLNNANQLNEERRLFYVALTRAKRKVFLLTKRNKESIFIKELIDNFKRKIKMIDLDQKNFK